MFEIVSPQAVFAKSCYLLYNMKALTLNVLSRNTLRCSKGFLGIREYVVKNMIIRTYF